MAFKAGSWSSLPIDYVIEKYGIPYAKKKFGPKAFYAHLNKMGRRSRRKPRRASRRIYGVGVRRSRGLARRRLMDSDEEMEVAPGITYKRSSSSSLSRAVKKSKASKMSVLVGQTERKVHYEKLVLSGVAPSETVDTRTLYEMQLYNVGQGAYRGQRLAQKIKALKINIAGTIYSNNTSTAQSFRFLVVCDKKPALGDRKQNFFLPKSEENVPHNFVTTGDYSQIVEPLNISRYRVISDRKFKVAPRVTSNSSDANVLINYWVNVDRNIDYLAESDGATNQQKITPNFYLFVYSELENSAGGDAVAVANINTYQHFIG